MESGVSGFIKGVGIGVAGVVVKPVNSKFYIIQKKIHIIICFFFCCLSKGGWCCGFSNANV